MAPPVTARVDPSNVKLPESSSAPDVPAKTTLPEVKSPIVAVSALRVSINAFPSMNRCCHSFEEEPKFLLPSVAGTRSPPIVAPAPTIRPPFAVTIPANAALPVGL